MKAKKLYDSAIIIRRLAVDFAGKTQTHQHFRPFNRIIVVIIDLKSLVNLTWHGPVTSAHLLQRMKYDMMSEVVCELNAIVDNAPSHYN